MDFIDDFIKEYKGNPCLWKANCADFKNRVKRQEAYLKLIDVATKHGEHYNVERTKQKINNLRCAFRHQLKKYNELKKKGEKYEPYCPKRRYFESLMFLKDEEINDKRTKRDTKPAATSNSGENSICGQSDNPCEDLSDFEVVPKKQIECEKLLNNSTEFCTNIFEEAVSTEPVLRSSKSAVSIKEVEVIIPSEIYEANEDKCVNVPNNTTSTNQVKEYIENQNDAEKYNRHKHASFYSRKRSASMSSQLSNENETQIHKSVKADISTLDFERLLSLAFKSVSNNMDDHFSNFGKIIAHKLRSMETMQAIYAEKIIADVLYQGQMKMLSTGSINQIQHKGNISVYGEDHNK